MNTEENYMNTEEMAERLKTSASNVRKYSIALEKNGYKFKTGSKGKRYFTDTDQMILAQLKYVIQNKNLSLEIGASTVLAGFNTKRSGSGTDDTQNENEENNHSLTVPQAYENSVPPDIIGTITEHFKEQRERNNELVGINNKLLGMIEKYEAALSDSKNDLRELEEQRRMDREQMSERMEQLQDSFNKQLQANFDKQTEQMKKHIESRDKEMMEYIRSSQKQQQQHLLEIAAAQEKEREHKKSFFARLFGN
ncbi:hypothetical protein IAE23_29360 [Bacillus sp. S35]|nr:hypothetical protein [Bacillus sp. S35]